jgi:hypothetical protein
MKKFTFYVEGPEKEVAVIAENQKDAHKKVWESLTDDERNIAACIDWIDEDEIAA